LAWWWWCGITIFSYHQSCHWTPIIHVQFVQAETIIPIWLLLYNDRNIKHLTNPAIWNEENLCQWVDQYVIEYSRYNLLLVYRAEEIQVM
jgi:hypothetical protein